MAIKLIPKAEHISLHLVEHIQGTSWVEIGLLLNGSQWLGSIRILAPQKLLKDIDLEMKVAQLEQGVQSEEQLRINHRLASSKAEIKLYINQTIQLTLRTLI